MKMAANVWKILKCYPALSAALVNVGVVLLSYFGFHVSGDQLIYIAGLAAALLGVVVHSNVTPVAKLNSILQIVADRKAYPEDVGAKVKPIRITNSGPTGNETPLPRVHTMPPPPDVDESVITTIEKGSKP